MRRPRLYVNFAAELDWLIALEFGRVDDGQPPENWVGVSGQFGFLRERPGGRVVGFKVVDFSAFDVEDQEVAEIWSGPRFDAPALGLADASAGEVVVATRALFGDGPSINRVYFNAAAGHRGETALGLWLACLQAGDSMAHFGLGYTLYELNRHREAYRHLRHYTEIAPAHSWNWCWLGRAAQAIGELGEARRAYERAIELEKETGVSTDAADRLAELTAGGV
jgi:tetratricopeptide (TPR) repeat protein